MGTPQHIRGLLRLVREGNRCISCIAVELDVPRLVVVTDLASMAGVFAITFSSAVCAGCNEPRAVVRSR